MELSALKLVIAKGPREGETLEFRPGSKIRLGRVVRGNNLPIKDDGISSKHFVIESESGKWALRDLGSSNGTLVNDAKVLPETPLELSDGDEIKIGEFTSITVEIDGYEESRVRRNPRRGAAAAAPIVESRGWRGKLGAKESEPEKENGDEIEVVEKRRRGRPPKARVLKSEVEPLPVPSGENLVRPVSTRRTRSSKNEELGGGEGLKMEPRRTRGSSRRKNVPEEELPVSDKVGIPELRVMGDCEGVKLEPKSTCGSSRRKNVEVGDSIRIDGENDQALKGLNFYQEVHEEGRGSGDKGGNPNASSSGVKESVDKDIDGNGSGSGVGKGGDRGGSTNASTSGVKESVDLEMMTMGEWFDFLEVYLVKQINDETEEVIAEMKEKAKRTQEYIAEQKKQGDMPVA